MSHHAPDDLSPELLAAYLDGELDGAARATVEAWLARHPEAAAEVEGQRRLTALWQTADPPAPTEADWARTLAGIEASLAPPIRRRPLGPGRTVVAAAILAAAAAALMLAVGLPGPSPRPPEPEEALPLVSADEVRIETLEEADRGAILIGEPPLLEPLVLLTAAEVKVHRALPDDAGRQARVETEESSGVPMIVMPPPEPNRAP